MVEYFIIPNLSEVYRDTHINQDITKKLKDFYKCSLIFLKQELKDFYKYSVFFLKEDPDIHTNYIKEITLDKEHFLIKDNNGRTVLSLSKGNINSTSDQLSKLLLSLTGIYYSIKDNFLNIGMDIEKDFINSVSIFYDPSDSFQMGKLIFDFKYLLELKTQQNKFLELSICEKIKLFFTFVKERIKESENKDKIEVYTQNPSGNTDNADEVFNELKKIFKDWDGFEKFINKLYPKKNEELPDKTQDISKKNDKEHKTFSWKIIGISILIIFLGGGVWMYNKNSITVS